MATIRKRGGRWYAEVRIKKQRRSATRPTKKQAQEWARLAELELSGDIIPGMTFGHACQRYELEVSPTKRGWKKEVIRLQRLQRDEISWIALTELTREDLNRWILTELKRIKPSSVNRELNLISAVLETARKNWRWIASNPCRDVTRPKNPPPRDSRYSENDIARILDALGYDEHKPVTTQRQRIAVAFLLAIETAMRQGELWGLTADRIHLDRKYVTLIETKNGDARNVPLSTRAVELLKKIDGLGNQASCGVMFRRALELAGIKGRTFHDTRHEAATRLARKIDVLDLARMMGVRDVRTLRVYYNATATEIAERLG